MNRQFDLDFVKKRREQLGLSQAAMAKLMGFSSSSVYYKYEAGLYKFRAEMLPALSQALQCDPRDFFCPAVC